MHVVCDRTESFPDVLLLHLYNPAIYWILHGETLGVMTMETTIIQDCRPHVASKDRNLLSFNIGKLF